MPSLFDGAAAVAGATVDAVFAAPFTLLPRALAAGDVNGRSGADPARPSVSFAGIYSEEGQMMRPEWRAKPDDLTSAIVAAPPSVDVAAAAFAQRPREGDHVRRVDTGEMYRIADIRERHPGRLVLGLTRMT